ncbi:MAG: hypothetical protein GWM90_18350, partial [Gemmatimonadetes bacterium]|nr:type II and III secretion system protein [Gemmatimonadota bacterium]NIQ56327.1 type II and III secretion system protein [Gemmatimonadota bacterium]NIU76517.1 hypothetical protein [Gammaproteobacteria bacterium]NIX45982.1 hypothetical protein [Gemmatimonadota bacterium]NIY10297.1 hypothetical protein [Gemmatimonadota bacterium]
MRITILFGLLALALPVAAQAPVPGGSGPARRSLTNVRITARTVVVDREAITRAGLSYVVLGGGVRVRAHRPNDSGAAGIRVGVHGVEAFLDAARRQRWIRRESTQQVLTLDGSEGVVASTDLSVSGFAARTRGPSLMVVPRVLADGSIHLRISARHGDRVTYAWGYGVDGSPAAVETELIARDGEEVVVASSSAVRSTREAG